VDGRSAVCDTDEPRVHHSPDRITFIKSLLCITRDCCYICIPYHSRALSTWSNTNCVITRFNHYTGRRCSLRTAYMTPITHLPMLGLASPDLISWRTQLNICILHNELTDQPVAGCTSPCCGAFGSTCICVRKGGVTGAAPSALASVLGLPSSFLCRCSSYSSLCSADRKTDRQSNLPFLPCFAVSFPQCFRLILLHSVLERRAARTLLIASFFFLFSRSLGLGQLAKDPLSPPLLVKAGRY
jgi:hypothetical protein